MAFSVVGNGCLFTPSNICDVESAMAIAIYTYRVLPQLLEMGNTRFQYNSVSGELPSVLASGSSIPVAYAPLLRDPYSGSHARHFTIAFRTHAPPISPQF